MHEDGATREERWWRAEPEHPLEETLAEAVGSTSAPDVPLAVLLSGGLDSSLIAVARRAELDEPLRTFTVGFADAGLRRARAGPRGRRAIGSQHEELLVETNVAEDLPEIARGLEQPLADAGGDPALGTSAAVAAEVKVALAGDGGDEVFGGYSRYAWDPGRRAPARALGPLARCSERGGRKNVVRRASEAAQARREARRPRATSPGSR